MGERITGHLRSNIVGYVALFIALTAGAYAAGLKKNSVKSKHIKNGQVLTQDIGDGAVTAAKLGPDAVDASKVGADVLGGGDIDESTLSGVNAATLEGSPAGAFALAGHDHDAAYVNEGQANRVTAAMIPDTFRSIQLPLKSFIECDTDAGAEINFTSGVDRFPDFSNNPTDGAGFSLRFDDTAGSEDEDTEVCTQVITPADSSVGSIDVVARTSKDASGGAVERLRCGISVNGQAQTFDTVDVEIMSPSFHFCQFTQNVNPFASVAISLDIASPGTMDDVVDLHSIAVRYVAVQ